MRGYKLQLVCRIEDQETLWLVSGTAWKERTEHLLRTEYRGIDTAAQPPILWRMWWDRGEVV